MKKNIIIGSFLVTSILIALAFYLGENKKLAELTEVKETPPKKISENLQKLATLNESEFPKYQGRMVIGEGLRPMKTIPRKIRLINKADPNWDKKTVSYLNGSSDYDRKIQITKKGGLILIGLNKDLGINFEKAEISFIQRDGTRGSFEALVNSDTGLIEMVISKNINDSIQEPEVKIKNLEVKFNPFADAASEDEKKELNEGNIEESLENVNLVDFDAQQYEEEIKYQERKLKEQNGHANFKKYVEEIKRQISSENK